MVAKDGEEESAFHFSSANISGAFLVCQAQSKSTRDVQMSDRSPCSLSIYRRSREIELSLNIDTNSAFLQNLHSDFPYWSHLGKMTSSLSKQRFASFVNLSET